MIITRDNKDKPIDPRRLCHSFSYEDAIRYGVERAVILRGVYLETLKSSDRVGRSSIPLSKSYIRAHYPYIPANRARYHVRSLCASGELVCENFQGSKQKYYYLSGKTQRKQDDLVWFRVRDAYNCGVDCAVLLNRIRYFSGQCTDNPYTPGGLVWVKTSKRIISERMPYLGGNKKVAKLLKYLVAAGILHCRSGMSRRNPSALRYAIPREFFGENVDWGQYIDIDQEGTEVVYNMNETGGKFSTPIGLKKDPHISIIEKREKKAVAGCRPRGRSGGKHNRRIQTWD